MAIKRGIEGFHENDEKVEKPEKSVRIADSEAGNDASKRA
jgi:hypothetical protein